jgi:hypothetical protein
MKNWTKIKICYFIVIGFASLFYTFEQVGEKPPVFIFPIVAFSSFIFGTVFLKGASMNMKMTIGNMQAPLKSIFSDPLPYYHFVAIASFISGFIGLLKDLLFSSPINPISLFEISFSFGLYFSVIVANKNFIKEPHKLKKL